MKVHLGIRSNYDLAHINAQIFYTNSKKFVYHRVTARNILEESFPTIVCHSATFPEMAPEGGQSITLSSTVVSSANLQSL